MKTLTKILLGIITSLALIPSVAFATPTLVDRLNNDHIEPLIKTDFIKVLSTKASIFPYASTTAISATTICIGTDCRTVWPSGSGGTPGGSNTQIQFNDSAAFGGDANLTFDKTAQRLTVPNASTTYITAVMASTSQAIFAGGPWVDARSCGAKGDGVTDDSTAINNCITDLSTNKGGGKLYISAAPSRSATTKYNICAASINMKPYIDVEVQRGVEIQVCNGFATSTVVFPSNTNGTYFAHWKGGTFSEAGTGKKLWTAFNVESQNINGGVFWNTISDVVINLPSVCIRSSVIGGASGWLNSNTYRDIVCNDPTNAWTFNDDRTGAFVIDETLFDNVQVQSNVSTETCFGDLKAWNTQLINAFCYDMNATSTSLNINQASLSTLIEGGYLTSYNFVDNGQRTVMVGDRLWMHYGTSTVGSFYQYANGAVIIGTSTTNATTYPLNIIDSVVSLGIGTSKFNSKIAFYTAGTGNHQQDFCQAATTTGQSPNSGNIVCSAREGFFINVDSDQTSTAGKFAIRQNRSDGGITTTGELFTVVEPGIVTFANGSTTVLSASSALCISTDCRTAWPSSSVAGADTQVQFNDGGAFAGNANLTFNKTTGITTAVYASSTALSVSTGAFFNTGAGAASFQPVMVGSTTPPLFTTGSLAPLSVFRKENTVVNTFYPVIQAIEVNNAGAVVSGGGPCYSYALHSNTTGRELARDCVMYDNTLSFIAGAKINFVTDANGNFLPYMRVNRLGNIVFGATTTDPGNSVARVTALNPVSSTQDLFHGDQGTGTATTTVFAIKSTGFTGIATSSPHEALTVNGNAYIAGFITSTSTLKSTFPYASTTAITSDLASSTKLIVGWGGTSVPSITFSGEENTGIYHSVSANQFSFGTAGQNRMTISNAGISIAQDILVANGVVTSGSVTGASTFPYASSTAFSSPTICLGTDCRTAWPSSSAVGGSDTQVQFNDGGSALGGNAGFTFNKTDARATITYASSTAVTATSFFTTNAVHIGSTTLQAFTATNATTTNATTTALYVSGIASVGSTSPNAILSVNPTAGLAPYEFLVGSSTATAFSINNTGNIGVKTATANSALTVNGNIDFGSVGGGQMIFIRTGSTDASNDFCTGATGNSGTIGCSARQAYVINIDSDNTASSNAFAIRHDKTAIDTLTTGELFRVDELAHVGISTSTPFAALQVATTSTNSGGFAPQIAITDNGAGANLKHWTITNTQGILYIGTSSDVYASSTPSAVTILNNGAFLIGSSTNAALGLGGLGISQKFFAPNITNSNTGDYVCFNTSTGEIEQSSTACSLSSLRWKQNVRPLTYGLNEILKLNPVLYDLKPQYGTAKNQPGFIAEEAVKVVPNLVPIDKEGKPASFDYPKLTSVLTKAIQEFYQRFQALVTRVTGVEKKVADQQKEIDDLKLQLKTIVDKNGLTAQ